MTILDCILAALTSIRVNVLRSALTALGIIIGVGAVITMVAIGAGAEARVQELISSLGSNLLMVQPGSTTSSGAHLGRGSRPTITEADANAIQDEVANIVVAQLLFLANDDPKVDINLYINTPGGAVTAGLSIIDTMRYIPGDVATYIIGQAASMGSLVACSGAKGKRYTLPHSKNLMHQPLLAGVLEGQATDLEIEAREMLRLRGVLYDLYAECTGQTTPMRYTER